MMEKKQDQNDEIEIDLGRVFRAIWHRAWLVAIVSVLSAVLVLAGTIFLITPQYQSSALFYVNNNSISIGDASLSISSGDLTTSRNLVDSYIVILNTRETYIDVIDYAGVDRTYTELKNMISSESVNDTEIFRVTVTSPDPQEAERIANAIAYILPKRIGTIIDGTSAKVAEAAIVAATPSSPNYTGNTMLGFVVAFVLSAGIIALREIFDITVRSEDDIKQSCKHPILVSVPDMSVSGKGGSYYGYGSSRTKKKSGLYASSKQSSGHAIMGANISFAASEAYKLLRTKLQFSFADENNCRVIGLSSALSGEGKSLTAVNLAFTLSQLNKRVLLVDCDMRRPTLAEKLGILKHPGLSSYLTRQCHLNELLQRCELKGNEDAFHVISAGQNPPNPIELLSSERMKKALSAMRQVYDYVILDLPPVGEVSDAMAVAKETDGILLVVRQSLCDRVALTEAVRQFEFIDSKILGVVFNCTNEHGGKYGKSYYRRYGKSYYKYGNSYEKSSASGKDSGK